MGEECISDNIQIAPIAVAIWIGRVPGRPKEVDGLGEYVIVDHSSVYREDAHEEYNVTAMEDGRKHLQREREGEGG